MTNLTRRVFLKASGVWGPALIAPQVLLAEQAKPRESAPAAGRSTTRETYETHAKGLRIFPGQWRPHYPFEQIAWISPAWPSQDYLWLDFPEAIFVGERLVFLSHVNPALQSQYPDLPAVAWKKNPRGLEFERACPTALCLVEGLCKVVSRRSRWNSIYTMAAMSHSGRSRCRHVCICGRVGNLPSLRATTSSCMIPTGAGSR